MRIGKGARFSIATLDKIFKRRIAHLELALIIGLARIHGGKLPLAGGVIHQGGQSHLRMVLDQHERVQAVGSRDLAPQMDVVLGPQAASAGPGRNRIGEEAHLVGTDIGILVHSDPDGIKHRCDPGGSDLGIVRLHGCSRVPAHLGARRVVGFQVIGVQLNEAGDQIVPVQILARASRFADIGDDPAIDADRSQPYLVGEHDPGVGEDKIPEGNTIHRRTVLAFRIGSALTEVDDSLAKSSAARACRRLAGGR